LFSDINIDAVSKDRERNLDCGGFAGRQSSEIYVASLRSTPLAENCQGMDFCGKNGGWDTHSKAQGKTNNN
jgi:hypothetical protein